MEIELPWPPSTNTYWRNVNGKVLISKAGRRYRRDVALLARGRMEGRLSVTIEAFPPDKRKRDLDNILKALLDSLEKAGVYEDDSQIDHLAVYRRPVMAPGRVEISIHRLD